MGQAATPQNDNIEVSVSKAKSRHGSNESNWFIGLSASLSSSTVSVGAAAGIGSAECFSSHSQLGRGKFTLSVLGSDMAGCVPVGLVFSNFWPDPY